MRPPRAHPIPRTHPQVVSGPHSALCSVCLAVAVRDLHRRMATIRRLDRLRRKADEEQS